MTQTFDKENFKQQVALKVKALCRKSIQEATPQQVFQAVCSTIKEEIVDEWIATHKAFCENDSKIVIICIHHIPRDHDQIRLQNLNLLCQFLIA